MRSDALGGLIDPPAVTIIGASPNGQITEHLVRNLGNRSCRFGGRIHLVNPKYDRMFDRACHRAPEEIEKAPGLVYLLVPGERCLDVLHRLRERPTGVVLYPESSHRSGGYEVDVAAWGRAHDVPVLGPQSTGVVSTQALLLGLLAPIPERVESGAVALVSQSGGVLAGMVKYLAQRGIGIDTALATGTGAGLSLESAAMALVDRPAVKLIGLYIEGLTDASSLAGVLATAEGAGKPVIMFVGGGSEVGRRAMASHSGMAATPRRQVVGIADQYGAVLAENLDSLVWSIEALDAVMDDRPTGDDVLLFTDSGGGGVAMADTLVAHGVGLAEPSEAARTALGGGDRCWNPFDFGAGSLSDLTQQAEQVTIVGAESRFGLHVYASTVGFPVEEESVQIREIDQFRRTVAEMGRLPIIASTFPFQRTRAMDAEPRRALLGLGSVESAIKIRAITRWARPSPAHDETIEESESPLAVSGVIDLSGGGGTITGPAAQAVLDMLPLAWPNQVTVIELADLATASNLRFPLVAKTEVGVPHRATLGGVLTGIDSHSGLTSAVMYLLERFGPPVSVSEHVDHEAEYFLGALRDREVAYIVFGLGGADAGDANVRLAPVTSAQARRLVRLVAPPPDVDIITPAIQALGEWMGRAPAAEAVDLNPLVVRMGKLVALDAKVHLGS